MLKLFVSVAIVFALASNALGASGSDSAPAKSEVVVKETASQPAPAPAKTEARPDGKLKADVLKLVADAKAGKSGTTTPRRQQPPQSNNLSKGKKIAIVAVIAAAVIITIVVLHTRSNLFDGGF